MNFEYNLPVNLIFGRGKISVIGEKAACFGKKALIVTGENSTKKSGLLYKTQQLLKQQAIENVVFDKVRQNPLTTTAQQGGEIAANEGCDVIIALGGGSIIDCAKAIAVKAVNEGDPQDYIFGKSFDKALPIIAVPTTCGTGSECNGFAVLTNPENGDKKSLKSSLVIPKVSIIDSTLMETMPKSVATSVCFDALCHCMEAYISKASQPMSQYMALNGIKLISENLPKICQDKSDGEVWDNLTWASSLGGMVIYLSGVTLPHGMEHPASGLKNIVHAKGLAALTPVIIQESCKAAKEQELQDVLNKYKTISNILDPCAEDCTQAVINFLKKAQLHIGLADLGIVKEDIDWMSENCLKVSQSAINNHPVTFNQQQIYQIYQKALNYQQ